MWFTALLIGFAGSLHCLGMCSPLVMAVTARKPSAFMSRLLYNVGRIAIYAFMGALMSGVGIVLPLNDYQNILSIVLGVVLLLIGFGAMRTLTVPGLTAATQRFTMRLKIIFAKFLQRKTPGTVLFLGALNGMLPCGLTLIALTWCVTLSGPVDGFNFMLLFGAGTLPVMLGFTSTLPLLVKKLNWSIHKLTTSMIILSGCVLIARVFLIHMSHAHSVDEGFIEIILCR